MSPHTHIPDEAVTVPDEVPLRDTVLRIALNAYAAGTGAQSWDALARVIGPHDADVYKRAVASTVEPFVSVLAAWRVERDDLREEVEDLRELARTFAREVADIARALGFEGDNAEPDPADILSRIEKVKAAALPVLNTAKGSEIESLHAQVVKLLADQDEDLKEIARLHKWTRSEVAGVLDDLAIEMEAKQRWMREEDQRTIRSSGLGEGVRMVRARAASLRGKR